MNKEFSIRKDLHILGALRSDENTSPIDTACNQKSEGKRSYSFRSEKD